MDRGAWRATVYRVVESDMTDLQVESKASPSVSSDAHEREYTIPSPTEPKSSIS